MITLRTSKENYESGVVFDLFNKEPLDISMGDVFTLEIIETGEIKRLQVVALNLCEIVDTYPDCEDESDVYAIYGVHINEFPVYHIQSRTLDFTNFHGSSDAYEVLQKRVKKLLDVYDKETLEQYGVIAISFIDQKN